MGRLRVPVPPLVSSLRVTDTGRGLVRISGHDTHADHRRGKCNALIGKFGYVRTSRVASSANPG